MSAVGEFYSLRKSLLATLLVCKIEVRNCGVKRDYMRARPHSDAILFKENMSDLSGRPGALQVSSVL